MKVLATIIVFIAICAIAFVFVSLIRFVFVHIKAYLIRRKLSKLDDSETKKDD